MTTASEALLGRADAAKLLGVSVRTVDTLISNGDLPAVRIGKAVRIRPSALDYLVEARETRGPSRQRKGGAR